MNEITQPNPSDVMSPDDIAMLKELGERHKTEFDKKQLAMPWLKIVQSMSGYVKVDDPQYIDAAREGDIIDDVTQKLRKRIAFIPVATEVNYTEWKPNRGPMVKPWFKDSSAYDAAEGTFGARRAANGNDIVPNDVYFGIALDEHGGNIECILAFTGTQAKKARRLATLIDEVNLPDGAGGTFKPPMYYQTYGLSTVREKNDKGAWMGWKIQPGPSTLKLPNGRKLFEQAKEMRERYNKGELRPVPTESTVASENQSRAQSDDNIPF